MPDGRTMPQTSEPRSLLLDTHVRIWFMLADAELTISGRTAINRAAASFCVGHWLSG